MPSPDRSHSNKSMKMNTITFEFHRTMISFVKNITFEFDDFFFKLKHSKVVKTDLKKVKIPPQKDKVPAVHNAKLKAINNIENLNNTCQNMVAWKEQTCSHEMY